MNAELLIHGTLRNGRTILKNSYCTQPFKLADITEERNDPVLSLMLMSSSPGILDRDDYIIRIELDENASIHLETQSYQRIFKMESGARQQMKVMMKRSSSLIFLPHPVVPHNCSSFSAKNTFYLSEKCLLIWGEILTCGRRLSGEVFSLSRFHSQTEIYLVDKLIVKENFLMSPSTIDITAIGQLEGFTHQASFTCIGSELNNPLELDKINKLLALEKDISFGISAIHVHGFIVRILGFRAEQLHNLQKKMAAHLIASQKKVSPKESYYAK